MQQFGDRQLFVINAFALGPWATGMNISMSIVDVSVLKSTGPDIAKILSTMRFLGPAYRYLILGYPPFVKHLLDEGDADGMPWDGYRMQAMVGGEGMTEELRDHLLQRFASVYSGYGATDIEIGMAGESPASVAIRRLARARPDLRRALFGDDSRLPMVFQYNPLIHYLEVNAQREVICTISRLDEGTYRLTSAESSWRWLHMNAVGMEVGVEDVSESLGALSLQGPLSRAILQQVSPADLATLKYFRLAHTQPGQRRVVVPSLRALRRSHADLGGRVTNQVHGGFHANSPRSGEWLVVNGERRGNPKS